MGKLHKYFLHIITIAFTIFFHACDNAESTKPIIKMESSTDSVTSFKSDSQKVAISVLAANRQVLTAIKNKDYKTFATFIHPVKGFRFSPNAYLDSVTDQTLSATQFVDLTSKNWRQQLIWEMDMEGDSIRLTVGKYFEQYLNDVDFSNAPEVAFNKILRSNIDRNVMKKVYGKYNFVDNYISGFDENDGGHDWRSLRLVFDNFNGRYYLIGIINDQYEI